MMYITGLSFGMVLGGISVDNNSNETSYSLLFVGGFISTVAWVSSIPIKLRN